MHQKLAAIQASEQKSPSLDITKILITAGSDVNIISNNGKTALDYANYRLTQEKDIYSQKIVNLLLETGAKPGKIESKD